MKKVFALFAAAVLLAAVPLPVAADEEITTGEAEEEEIPEETEAPDYEYSVDADGYATLTKYLFNDTHEGPLTVPSEVAGHTVSYIGNACFINAAGITEITIPATVTDMGESVFFGCTALERFYVEPENPYFSATDDGVLLADNNAFLFAYPAGRTDETYTFPSGIDEIAPGAFGFSANLKELTLPDSLVFIDNWAFAYSGIEKVTFGESVAQVDNYAFAFCDNLQEVTLNSGLETILHAAFYCDGALTQVTLPDTLTYIGQYAFCGTGLSCITIPASLEEISYCAFGYDKDEKALPEFIIYGEPYTMAQMYASDSDPENNYENHFAFIAVADASIPYELGGGMLYEEATGEELVETETNENGEVIVIETDAEGNPVNPEEKLGAGLKDNRRLQMMLGIGGGVLVVLAVILLGAFAKKPKRSKQEAQDEPETQDAPEETEQEDEEA